MAAVLGGVQTLATSSFDEALGLPSDDAVRISLRTQQILAYETGVARTADPLGGSYFVESLTDELRGRGLGLPRHDRGAGRGARRARVGLAARRARRAGLPASASPSTRATGSSSASTASQVDVAHVRDAPSDGECRRPSRRRSSGWPRSSERSDADGCAARSSAARQGRPPLGREHDPARSSTPSAPTRPSARSATSWQRRGGDSMTTIAELVERASRRYGRTRGRRRRGPRG